MQAYSFTPIQLGTIIQEYTYTGAAHLAAAVAPHQRLQPPVHHYPDDTFIQLYRDSVIQLYRYTGIQSYSSTIIQLNTVIQSCGYTIIYSHAVIQLYTVVQSVIQGRRASRPQSRHTNGSSPPSTTTWSRARTCRPRNGCAPSPACPSSPPCTRGACRGWG